MKGEKKPLDHYLAEFDSLMEYCSEYHAKKNSQDWLSIRDRYAQWRISADEKNRIPRLIHQIWIGGNMPSPYQNFISKVKDVNPAFEHKLWTESNIDFELETGNLVNKISNPGQKSDVLRYEILKKYGGIYLDLDFVALRSFETLLGLEFFTGIVYANKPALANGLIGAAPDHPIISECLQNVGENNDPNDFMEIMNKTGPFLLTRTFMNRYLSLDRCVALPNGYFYPYPNFPAHRTKGENFEDYLKSQTICVHLWHCSWMKSKSQNTEGFLQRLRTLFMR